MADNTEYYPMDVIPSKEEEVDNFSKIVLLYELDKERNLGDIGFGCYNFNIKAWCTVAGEPMNSICWAYIPAPFSIPKSWQPIEVE